jgi:hypothetical protein
VEAGQRRYAGTDPGSAYGAILAYGTEQASDPPAPHERAITDLIAPERPGSAIDMVNAVTRETGQDAMGWRVDRLLRMLGGLQQEQRQRGPPPGEG